MCVNVCDSEEEGHVSFTYFSFHPSHYYCGSYFVAKLLLIPCHVAACLALRNAVFGRELCLPQCITTANFQWTCWCLGVCV